jgi:hypothetical protein
MRDPEIARRWASMTREWCYFPLVKGASILPPWAFPGPWMSKQMGPYMGPGPGPSLGGMRLVAWHFSSLRMAPDGTVIQYANPEYALTLETIRVVYEPYVRELRAAMLSPG